MTDDQISESLAALSTEERLALALKMQTSERNIYRWQERPPTKNKLVRAALERELGRVK